MRRLASPAPSASSASTGRAPSGRLTQRSPTRSSSASATSRLPPPMSPTRPIGRKKPEITPWAAKWASSAPLSTRSCDAGLRRDRGHQVRPIGRPPDRLGRGGVEARHAHGVGDGAKPAHRLDRAPEALGGDRAGLRQSLAETAQGLLVEARQGCAAELVVDDEADRVRADVDRRRTGGDRRGSRGWDRAPADARWTGPAPCVGRAWRSSCTRRAWQRGGTLLREQDPGQLQAEAGLAAQRRAPEAEEPLGLGAGVVRQYVDRPNPGEAQAMCR